MSVRSWARSHWMELPAMVPHPFWKQCFVSRASTCGHTLSQSPSPRLEVAGSYFVVPPTTLLEAVLGQERQHLPS